MQNNPQTVLITGASSGIGWELAKLFAGDGYKLILTARSGDKLMQLAEDLKYNFKVETVIITMDLAKANSARQLYEEIQRQGLSVDILINNAGYGTMTTFAESDLKDALEMIQLNIASLTELTRLFLPSMVEHKLGKIMNVASTAAFQPGPFMAVYYATKAYVLSFSEALSEELSGTGITVTTLCPGPTTTNFMARAGAEKTNLARSKVMMDSQTVAKIGYLGLFKGKRVVITGRLNRIGVVLARITPHAIMLKIIRYMKNER